MLVRYLVSEASAAWSRMPGVEYDLPDAEAVAAITAGKAEAVKSVVPEAATRTAPETATTAAARGRKA